MNRRDSLKALGLTAISSAVLLDACKPGKETEQASGMDSTKKAGRQDFEVERDKQLNAAKFFNEHEMATIAILTDIIIPKDEKSGSATDAKVPDFIEFIVKDIPSYQTPMRGGLRWLDLECFKRFEKSFADASQEQRINIVQGAGFFNLMRDLTASGFFTSEIGVKDLGYAGNKPNRWEGVPADVLKQYGLEGAV
jgi:hypothetical protein